jgi:hypothetical protein
MRLRSYLLTLIILLLVGCGDEHYDIPLVLDYGYFTISWIESEYPYMHNLTKDSIQVEVWAINIDSTAWYVKDTIKLGPYETKRCIKWMVLEDINYALMVKGQYVVIRGTSGR